MSILSESPGSQFHILHKLTFAPYFVGLRNMDEKRGGKLALHSQHAATCRYLIPTDDFYVGTSIFSMRLKKIQRLSFVFTWHGLEVAHLDFIQPGKLKMEAEENEDLRLRLRRKPTASTIYKTLHCH